MHGVCMHGVCVCMYVCMVCVYVDINPDVCIYVCMYVCMHGVYVDINPDPQSLIPNPSPLVYNT